MTVFAARIGRGPREELAAALQAVVADGHDAPSGVRTQVPITDAGAAAVHTRAREWTHARQNRMWQNALDAAHRECPFDLVYERYSLWLRAGAGFARRHDLPYVVEVNSPLRDEQRTYRHLAWEVRAARVEHLVFSCATRVVAVSSEVAAYVRARMRHHDRVKVVENGVDLARYRTPPLYARSGTFRIGFVGSLKPWHGVDVLIAATARLRHRMPSVRLVIVGDGPERASLHRQACEAGLADDVEFVGNVPKREVPRWLATMDVVTAPYPALDGFYFSPLKFTTTSPRAARLSPAAWGRCRMSCATARRRCSCRPVISKR